MKTLYMTKGLPASGKTTAAKALVATQPGTKRVNKDDLRAMIDGGKWSEANEKFVLNVRDYIVYDALGKGFHVIVDDTNLAPKHESVLRDLAKRSKAKFEILDFTNVTPEECIKRDLARPNSVGQKVIMDMYNRYLKPAPQIPPAYNEALEDVVLCDIDGTVAEMTDRGPFEWAKVGQDKLRPHVMKAARSFGPNVIFISGRDSVCRPETETWLKQNYGFGIPLGLYMRPAGDQRRDSIVKREIYENHIKGRYNVIAIFDDRPQVIRECWQALGLGDRVFNVGTGEEF
jgi:predicted kinase